VLFRSGEGPSRVVLAVAPDRAGLVMAHAEEAGVPVTSLGVAGGDRLAVGGLLDVDLAEATEAWRSALPRALGVEAAAAGAVERPF